MADYGSWTLNRLREALKSRHAKISGRKHELVERLEAYDRNSNFGQPSSIDPEFQMHLPDSTSYKDLHAEMHLPQVDSDKVITYLATYGKELDSKSCDLYSNGFINYVRLCEYDGMFFIRAECRAQMKVKVTYVVDACLDKFGVIQQCQCECGAGMGPHAHCKHVGAVLHGLVKFYEVGAFIVAETCTQKLQTFHHTKKHLGSPVKADTLKLPVKREIDFEPRPQEFVRQASYQDDFRNTCLNSGLLHDAPIVQCFAPANPYAALLDHCYYTAQDPMETFLMDWKVSEVGISELEVQAIQQATVGQAENSLWAAERQKRLTSSNFGRICKRTNRTDSVILARTLLSKKQINSPAIAHGRAYEAVAIQRYEEQQGCKTQKCGLFVHHQHPFLAASPDCLVNPELLVEVKCPFTAKNKSISPDTVPYLHEQNGTLTLDQKHDYYYQVQGQLMCTGAKAIDFVVYTCSDVKTMRIQRDDVFIQAMLAQLLDFYRLYFRPALLEMFLAKDYFRDIECHCYKVSSAV